MARSPSILILSKTICSSAAPFFCFPTKEENPEIKAVMITAHTSEQFRTPSAPRAGWVGITYNFGGSKKTDIDKD